MAEKPTICLNCTYHFIELHGGHIREHLCDASALPEVINYVTGEKDDTAKAKYSCCVDINTGGDCQEYTKKDK